MKNKNEIFGLAANIFAVLLLLAFVIIGLNKIGLYNLPEPIEDFLGTSDNRDAGVSVEDEDIYSLFKEEDNTSSSVTVAEVDYSNAGIILENLVSAKTYKQEVVITDYYGNMSKTRKLTVFRNNGMYEVAISDDKNNLLKSIKETSHHVVIHSAENDGGNDIIVSKGNFDISSECGFVVNVDEFLRFSTSLDEASFSKHSDKSGSYLVVSFNSQVGEVVYFQQYTVSLDYGIVTSVSCYDNDVLVYEMVTTSLEN